MGSLRADTKHGIKEKRRPHLQLNEFKEEIIPALNENKCDGGTLTECSVKASLLMLSRVSSIVRLQWDWIKNVDPDSGEIHPVNAKNKKYISYENDKKELEKILDDSLGDDELKNMAKQELSELQLSLIHI